MSKDSDPSTIYYYLSVEITNAVSSVEINGAPVITNPEGDELISTEPVNCWLKPGENTLKLNLDKPESGDEPFGAQAEIKLFIHDSNSEYPKIKELLAEIVYPARKTTPLSQNPPVTRSVTFTPHIDTPANLWEKAVRIKSLDHTDKAQILELINTLSTSLSNGDIDTAIKLFHFKIADEAVCENKSLEEIRDALKKNYQWLNQQSGLKSTELNPDEAKFTVCCDNRAVYISRTDDSNAVQLESDELYFDIPIFAGIIDGKWQIVR